MIAPGAGSLHGGLLRAAVLVPVVLAANAAGGLYRPRLSLSALDETPQLAIRGAACLAVVLALGQSLRCGFLSVPAARGAFLVSFTVYLVTAVCGRSVLYGLRRAMRRRGPGRPVLILGAGRVGRRIAGALREHPEYGLWPVGFLDAAVPRTSEPLALPVLGTPADLGRVAVDFGVRDVVVAFGSFGEYETAEAVETCRRLNLTAQVVPWPSGARTGAAPEGGARGDHLWGFPVRRCAAERERPGARFVKRFIDVAVAGGALLLLSPLLAAFAVAVRLDGGPGVIFRQKRIGHGGRAFTMLKFRSLRPATEGESETRWSIAHDDRLSKVGNLLRKTSIDELPQLWNVVKGEMSLVGPRPERPHFVERFSRAYPGYGQRHRMPTGLTGLAQINGLRGDTSIEDRARFDNYYIEHWSPWQDVAIALRTVAGLIRPGGS
ncbi:hypothetical protein BIV57_18615 [Mangrovactinospora gilvigrisea]|uniref:Bacterial sugar transferase domain-containing protein n=1 Tax=Mangrovactinospora gilvigrisea TaxID=1428644 RepID=A0A1J7BBI0_9ACTN|nr:hypothetical protein BIV57_18615 [Mangrovactinospora gilvigrisea]